MQSDDALDALHHDVDVTGQATTFADQIRADADLDPAGDPALAAAILYTAVTITDDPTRLDEIVDAADTTTEQATQSVEALHDDLDIALTAAVARARLPTVLAVLDAPDPVLNHAASFLHDWRLADTLTAYSPSAVIAATAYAASIAADWHVTQDAIADVTGTSTVTIRSRMDDLADHVPDASGDALDTLIDRSDLLDAIRDLHADLDRVPHKQDMADRGRYSTSPYDDRFESWDAALDAAGLDPERRSEAVDATDYLAEIRRLHATLDRTPTVTDMNDRGEYSATIAYRHWDSWDDAIDAADLPESRDAD